VEGDMRSHDRLVFVYTYRETLESAMTNLKKEIQAASSLPDQERCKKMLESGICGALLNIVSTLPIRYPATVAVGEDINWTDTVLLWELRCLYSQAR
jgi:hypothetical protein